LIFTAMVLICTPFGLAQWVQTNGPNGGTVTCFATSGPNLFAGTNGDGVFRSSDNGTSWTPVNTGLIDLKKIVRALAVSGTTLVAVTRDAGCRSTDNGTR